MKTLQSLLVMGLVSAAAFAHADNFTFTWTNSAITGAGTLFGNEVSPGVVLVTSGSITIFSDSTNTLSGSYDIVQNPEFPDWHYDNHYYYDDALMVGQNPQLDYFGLVFARGPQEIEIYYDDFWGSYFLSGTGADGSNLVDIYNPGVQGSFMAVPEPTSLAALGIGVLAFVKRRKKSSK